MKAIEEFKDAAKEKDIIFWNIHTCGMCGYRCGFLFDGDTVMYDSGCGCVTYGPVITPRSWEDVADQYNMQKSEKCIAKYDAFWGFTAQPQETTND